jgi:hypothetical protein
METADCDSKGARERGRKCGNESKKANLFGSV